MLEQNIQDKKDMVFSRQRDAQFSFDKEVAGVFMDMLSRSVPLYHENIALISSILERLLPKSARIYDLGCSLGALFAYIESHVVASYELLGIDSSSAMLEEANCLRSERVRNATGHSTSFIEGDFLSYSFKDADAFIMSYTLQFVRPLERPSLLTRLYSALKSGGVLVLSEKVIAHDVYTHKLFNDLYHAFKEGNGYSREEIAIKREALENILVPYTLEENISLLKSAGFKNIEIISKYLNFATILAIKD